MISDCPARFELDLVVEQFCTVLYVGSVAL